MTPYQQFVKKLLTTAEHIPPEGTITLSVEIGEFLSDRLSRPCVKLRTVIRLEKEVIRITEWGIMREGETYTIEASVPYTLSFPPESRT